MSAHFRKEEEVLLPLLARYGRDAFGQGPMVEMLGQHARIRSLVMQLSDEYADGNLRAETLGEIGELLEAHIRLEEREVSPMIEQALPEAALKEVASCLAVNETGLRVDRGYRRRAASSTTPGRDQATAKAAGADSWFGARLDRGEKQRREEVIWTRWPTCSRAGSRSGRKKILTKCVRQGRKLERVWEQRLAGH